MNLLSIVLREPNGTHIKTIPLATNLAKLLEFPCLSAEPTSVEHTSALRNGTLVGKTVRHDVSEPVRVLLEADDDTTLLTARRDLEWVFTMAEERQARRAGPRVWAEFQLARTATTFRSEIKRGQLVSDDDDVNVGWRTRQMELSLAWLRQWFWESLTKTELPLRSFASAKGTGGVNISNHSDADAGNWVEILGADVPGVLDAPVELQLTNTYANPSGPLNLYVYHNHRAAPTALNTTLEAEAATWYGTVSNVTNTSYSGGAGRQVTWSGTAEVLLAEWTLSSAVLSEFGGAYVHLWGRFPTLSNDTRLWLEVRYLSVTTLAKTQPFRTAAGSSTYQRFGALKLPPRMHNGSPAELKLRLYAQGLDANQRTLTCDHLSAFVADGYQHYKAIGYGLQQGVQLLDNPTDDDLRPIFFTREPSDQPGIWLRPGADQRLMVLQEGGGNQTDRSLLVQAYMRERRLTL